jgi:uncharacterized protein
MAENIASVLNIINRYYQIISSMNIKIDKLYLFGSYARGTADDDSDIDIAVVSNDFKGDRFIDRRILVPLRRNIDRRIEPIPFRPEDFQEYNPLVDEIVKYGMRII